MVTASELYFHLKKIFEGNDIDSPQFQSMCIIEHIFQKKLNRIFLEKKPVTAKQKADAENMAYRRLQGEPLQYILGKWEFYGLEFFVGEGVLIPRQDTETIIETTLSFKLPDSPVIADLCSGSGCIAVTVSKLIKNARVTAVEISEKAIEYLNKNIILNGADVIVLKGDVTDENTAKKLTKLDLILCNPPYLTSMDMERLQREVAFEPKEALFGGEDGLDFYEKITAIWKNSLKAHGILAYEIGAGQEKRVMKILEINGFTGIRTADDLCGVTRVVFGIKGKEEN